MESGIWKRFERDAKRPFGQAAAKYLRELDGDKRRAALCIESLAPYIGRTPIFEVDGDALRGYLNDRKEGKGAFSKPVMAGTINKELRVLRAILARACREWRWIPSVPRIRDVQGACKVAHPLSWEEKERVFAALPEYWATGPALFALNTGVRKEELTGLRWDQMVPLPASDAFLFVIKGKNGHQRAVICNTEARKAVNRQRGNGSRYVFPSRRAQNYGERLVAVNGVWREAWRAAGMPQGPHVLKGWHNLRHTFASWLRACEVAAEDRNALMGHHNADISQHYAQPDIERLLEAAERITNAARLRQCVVLRAVPVMV